MSTTYKVTDTFINETYQATMEQLEELADKYKDLTFYDDVDDLVENKGLSQDEAESQVKDDYDNVGTVDYLERVNIYAEEIDE